MIRYIDRAQDDDGNAIEASVLVTDYATGLNAPLFNDDGVTPLANPVTASSNGLFSFKIDAGIYTIRVSYGAFLHVQDATEIVDDPSISYLINDDATLVYGDLVYISDSAEVRKATPTGIEIYAAVYAVCVEETLANGAAGRFRTFGVVERSGTPGALGYLGQASEITETVPEFEAGDLFAVVLGRQISASQFLFKAPPGPTAIVREVVIVPDGWYGDRHGFRWGSTARDDWTDNDLWYQYTHGEADADCTIRITTSGGSMGVDAGDLGYGDSGSYVEFDVTEPGIYLFRVYAEGLWCNEIVAGALGSFTFTASKDGSFLSDTVADRRGRIWLSDTGWHEAFGVPFVKAFGTTVDVFSPGDLTFTISVDPSSHDFVGTVTWDGTEATASGYWQDFGGLINARITASTPTGSTVIVQMALHYSL